MLDSSRLSNERSFPHPLYIALFHGSSLDSQVNDFRMIDYPSRIYNAARNALSNKGAAMTSPSVKILALVALASGFLFVSTQLQFGQQPGQQPAPGAAAAAPAARGGRGAIDPRVQQRTYTFKDTNEEMPYAVFVSSKVSKDKKAPLIVALHGLGGNQNTMLGANALQLAEDGGYIVLGVMGYNSSGWYGAPAGMATGAGGAAAAAAPGGGRGGAPGAGAGRGAAPGGAPGAAAGRGGPGGGAAVGPNVPCDPKVSAADRGVGAAGAGGGRGASTTLGTPNETSKNSEKETMTVFEMIKKEFNIDENRIYLMGHSMGGAGTIYLGVKYASNWAAIGAEAPATAPAGINPTNYSLAPAKNVPMIIVQGDWDELVPVTGTRLWIDQAKELKMDYQYVEVACGTHGSVLTTGAPDIFAFFAKHSKSAK
jgi:predicted esterase